MTPVVWTLFERNEFMTFDLGIRGQNISLPAVAMPFDCYDEPLRVNTDVFKLPT